MAGKYQHYLQQMIQKGFKRPDGGARPSVWVYTRGQQPFVRRIEKVGGEDEFYSPVAEEQTTTLDDKITDWEAHRQADVRAWRGLAHGSPVDASKAADLVGLTGIRTRAHRQSLQLIFEELLPKIGKLLQDPDTLMSHIDNSHDIKVTISDQVLQAYGLSGEQASEVASSLEFKAICRMLSYATSEVVGHALSSALKDVDQVFREVFESGHFDVHNQHRNALEQQLDEGKLRADLLELDWFIIRNQTSQDWVLPDCAILQLSKCGSYSPFIFNEDEHKLAVILPLTADKALVGTLVNIDEVDVTGLTKGAVSCCYEFFLARNLSPEFVALSDEIGEKFTETIEDGVDVALNELDPLQSEKSLTEIPQLASLSFQTHQLDLDENQARGMAEKVMPYISSAGRNFDLSRLSSVVLCHNVVEAFNEFESAKECPFAEEDVRRYIWWSEGGGETPSYRLYIQATAAEVLCSPDNEAFDFALNILMQTCGQLHVRAVVWAGERTASEAISRYANPDTGDKIRDISIRSACTFMEALYGCQIAEADISYLEDFRDRLVTALAHYQALPLPITNDPETNDLRSYEIAEAINEIMHNSARYLALCHYLNIPATSEEHSKNLKDLLVEQNLYEWIYRLSFDLQRLRVNFSHPIDPLHVKALQLHSERLLWGRGMVIVSYESGGYLLPFQDQNINFENIRAQLDKTISATIPDDISQVIKSAFLGKAQ